MTVGNGRLVEWAAKAGFSFGSADKGGVLFYNRGGEDRYYVRPYAGEFLRITSASRREDEAYVLDARSEVAAEAFFWMKFGPGVRYSLNLERLRLPITKEEVAHPYVLDDGETTRLQLLGPNGEAALVVDAAWDPASDVAQLVKCSWALAHPISEVEESFLAVDGRPLFHVAR